ncbi:MAG: tetratricopeptide repeat protein, partial [Betaproteobacteria bacterium]
MGATGWVANYRGDAATYVRMVRACLGLAEQAGAERSTAVLRANLADAVMMAGDFDEAIVLLRQSVVELRALETSQLLGVVLGNLGGALLMKDETGEARATMSMALPLMRSHPMFGALFNHLA